MRHPKSVRRRFLRILYEHYMANPLEIVPPDVFIESGLERAELVPNAHYLADSGLIELMHGYNPSSFAGVRMAPRGIDLVENHYAFNRAFPPDLSEAEDETAAIPMLMERLVEEADLAPLDTSAAQALMLQLAKYPEMLTAAAQDFAPHDVVFYLRELAASYHSYYDAERILVDDEGVKKARLALVAATARVLHNGLAILGVNAPSKM